MTDERDDALLEAAARAYASRVPALPASLDDRIMAGVRARPLPGDAPADVTVVPLRRPSGALRWLLEPQQVRPAWGLALAAAAALAIWVLPRRAAPAGGAGPVPAATATRATDTVFVRFELVAPAARNVALAGSFNGWGDHAIALSRAGNGMWSVTVPLPVGEHHYQFVVDGTRWVNDPTAHAQVSDGFGGSNSVIVVGPRGVVRS